MRNSKKRKDRHAKNVRFNGWKWAFIALASVLAGLFFLFVGALQPVEVGAPNQSLAEPAEETFELSTRLNKEDTEQLINAYLSQAAGRDYDNYSIALTDQLEIRGALEFLGYDIPFALFLDPYVMENGNVQLRAEAVEVADYSLPVSMVMRLVGNQVAFPDFIAFDSEAQIVVIHLDELTEAYNFDIEMTTIDLMDNVIEMNLRIDEQTAFEQLS